MELFVSEHLTGQVRSMLGLESDDEDLNSAMDIYRTRIEQQQASGANVAPTERKRVLKPKPATWDSDFDGAWEEEADAWTYEDEQQAENTPAHAPAPAKKTAREKGKAAQQDTDLMDEDEPPAKKPAAKRATRTTKAAPAKKAPAKGRGRKAFVSSEEEEEEEDVVMESEDEPAPPPPKTRRAAATKSTAKTPAKTAAAKPAAKSTRQTKLNFSQSQKSGTQSKAVEISDDEISDDDAFEPAPAPAPRTRRR